MQNLLDWLGLALWGPAFLVWLGRLSTALLFLLLGLWLARRFAGLMRHAIEKRGGDAVLANFLRNTVFVAIALVVIVGALDRAGLPTASLLAALGAAGLAIGLALKDSLGNLASGVLLIVTRPFRAGDFVEIGGISGTVERIDLLQSVLISPDNKVISVPNAQVMGTAIINYTARPERRVDLVLTVPPDCDLARAFSCIQSSLQSDPVVLAQPAAQILVLRLTDTGVELGIRPWVPTAQVQLAQSTLLSTIRADLRSAGVGLAIPQRLIATRPGPGPSAASDAGAG